MISPDANIVIYAYNTDAVQHEICRAWLEEQLSKPESFALSWQVITAFLRITTTPKIFPKAFSQEEVHGFVNDWLSRPNVRILTPTERHWGIFERLLAENNIVGAKTMDAHLAALAIEHGATLATTDRDFANFTGLRIINPLAL